MIPTLLDEGLGYLPNSTAGAILAHFEMGTRFRQNILTRAPGQVLRATIPHRFFVPKMPGGRLLPKATKPTKHTFHVISS